MDPLAELEVTADKGGSGTNFVPCVRWIQRGVAKSVPERVKLSHDEIADIIKHTQDQLQSLQVQDDGQVSEDEEDQASVGSDDSDGKARVPRDDDESLMKRYGLDTYDDEDVNEATDSALGIGSLVVFDQAQGDPYLKDPRECDDDDSSDMEDFIIKPTDNLLLVGHVEGDAAILEVYVYNDVEDAFYVHHDILLPSYPLALEWLNYDPGEQTRGHLVAVGSMGPVIDIWDLDVVDSLEPAFSLGTAVCGKKKKKKKKKGQAKCTKSAGYGHSDAVLSLAWNRHAEHVLASGSVDQSVLLWDLNSGSVASKLTQHTEKVQALQWHPFEGQTLLTGCCDKMARVFDCRSQDAFKSWSVLGEVEKVLWNHFHPFSFFVADDSGHVFAIDARMDNAITWTLSAHEECINGLALSSQCPDCLVTGSSDNTVKVWDVADGAPTLVLDRNFNMGRIHALDTCPDAPFVIAIGADQPSNNIKVWDVRESSAVRKRFGSRSMVNPLGYSAFEFATADHAEESMDVAPTLPLPEACQTKPSGGAKSKFLKKNKRKGFN